MAEKYSLQETLDYVPDSSDNEGQADTTPEGSETEDCNPASDAEDAMELEEEYWESDEEGFEEDGQADQSYQSKDGNITWANTPSPRKCGRAPAASVIKLTPAPARYACARVEDIKTSFLLYFPTTIRKILIDRTNVEGKRVYGDDWKTGQILKHCMHVVLDLTAGLQGHTITCDNFFTSHALGQELLKKKMTMVGTIRKNKCELPPALLSTKDRAQFSSQFAFTETHSLVSYCPRKGKNVLLMSTCHKDAKVSDRNDKKPNVILYYDQCKGGVDNLDKMVATYSCKRKTSRWPMAMFFTILDVSAVNSYVVWKEVNPEWEKGKNFQRRLFLEQLGKALVSPEMERRQHLPRAPAAVRLLTATERFSSGNNEVSGPSAEPPSLKRKRCMACP